MAEELRPEDLFADESSPKDQEDAPAESKPKDPTAEELFGEIKEVTQPPAEEPEPQAAKEAAPPSMEDEKEVGGEEEEEDKLALQDPPDDGIVRRWYALHAHSGQESSVSRHLTAGALNLEQPDLITNVLVPMEKVTEMRGGSKRTAQHKFFPGYVLVQLPEHPEKYADLWHLIKDTPGVTGFIGSRTAPVPLEDSEVNAIVEVLRGERERPRPKVAFEEGERIKIIDGPFANFLGKIDEINPERGTMKVMVEIFERLTSIEVEFWQVEQV